MLKKTKKAGKEKEENLEKQKKEGENQNKILKTFLILGGIVILFALGYYFYAQTQIHIEYKQINFEMTRIGNITFYETRTLANSSEGSPFGFRLRTNPNDLKSIPFDDVENFRLLKLNGYGYSNNTFDCEGDGVIAMANLQRLFSEIGMNLVRDSNATCDPQGRYNYFYLKYGNETAIREVGSHCYNIVIKGNDAKCEILPATEKLMVEMYSRYLDLSK